MLDKIFRFFRWLIGILVVVLGLIFWWESKFTSIFWTLAGILITPILSAYIPPQKSFKVTFSLLCICLFIAGGVAIPSSNTEDRNISTTFAEDSTTSSPNESTSSSTSTSKTQPSNINNHLSDSDPSNIIQEKPETEDKNNSTTFAEDSTTSSPNESTSSSTSTSKTQPSNINNHLSDSDPSNTIQENPETNENTYEEIDSEDILAILLHQPYLESSNIQVHYASERKKIIPKIIDVLTQEPVNVELQGGGLFSNSYYSLTRYTGFACSYYGELKNNRPDGFGVLAHKNISLDNYETLHNLMYIGEFSDGRFHGYGIDFDRTSYVYNHIDLTMAGNADSELLKIYLWSYALADGNWKKGALSGDANLFTFDLYVQPPQNALTVLKNNAPDDYWANAIYPSVAVTKIKNGQKDGDTKEYLYNTLMYDGEMKKGIRNGKGISYFSNGQIEYNGHWKNGLFNGKGTLYDTTGQEIYSGKWKDGDYAS